MPAKKKITKAQLKARLAERKASRLYVKETTKHFVRKIEETIAKAMTDGEKATAVRFGFGGFPDAMRQLDFRTRIDKVVAKVKAQAGRAGWDVQIKLLHNGHVVFAIAVVNWYNKP